MPGTDTRSPDQGTRVTPLQGTYPSDRVLNPAHKVAPAGSVVVVDGLFLHRDELVGVWDFSIFLDVPFEVTAKRMATRDGTVPDPQHASMRRYVEAQQLYLGVCAPQQRASVVIDNTVLDAPRLVRVPQLDQGQEYPSRNAPKRPMRMSVFVRAAGVIPSFDLDVQRCRTCR